MKRKRVAYEEDIVHPAGRYPGAGGPDPKSRSVAAADVALSHKAHGTKPNDDFTQHKGQHGPVRGPAKEGPYPGVLPAEMSDAGYGQRRVGHLRCSYDKRAHRVGYRGDY